MIRFLVILWFSCCLLKIASFKYSPESKIGLAIVGGDEAVPHAYPYQVGLIINKVQFCGGSLISPNYVLTAAHCAVEIYRVDVILGAHNITDEEQTQLHRKHSEIIVHEDYDDVTYQNDIALIKLRKSVPLTTAIAIVRLVPETEAEETFVGETVITTGWGLTRDTLNPKLKDMSNTLNVVKVTAMESETCKTYYNDNFDDQVIYITENNICTSGDGKKGTCNGDSGGPLVFNGFQIGIVSAGDEFCEIGAPSVFTRIGKYLDWIKDHSDVN